MVGIWGAHSVPTGRFAAHLPLPIQKLSSVRRRERFWDNGAVRGRSWYEPIACWLIQAARVSGDMARVGDSPKVSAHHRLVLSGIAYRQRLIPLAWTWGRTSRGHSRASLPIALVRYGPSLLPAGVRVSLVGACESGHRPILLTVPAWG